MLPYSVTLHHLAPGARSAGVNFPDEQMPGVTPSQLAELLYALAVVAAGMTIYEPSSPEVRIKTERDVFVVRTRYRGLCFVSHEAALRGEEHTVAYILAVVAGQSEPVIAPARTYHRPATANPHNGSRAAIPLPRSVVPDWLKIALLLVLIVGCLGGGTWMLLKPARSLGPKFTYLPGESDELLRKAAGEYRTGIQEGDRRLIIGADGTLRIAKYGPAQAVAEEVIRTARGATQNGLAGLVTTDPYLMIVKPPDTVVLYGQTYKRVTP